MTRGHQQQQQVLTAIRAEQCRYLTITDDVILPGGGRQQREAEGHGREAHAQLVPEEYVGSDRGN